MFVRGVVTILHQQGVNALFFSDAMRFGVQVVHLHTEFISMEDKEAVVVTFEYQGDENAVNSVYEEYIERYPRGKIELRNNYTDSEPEGKEGTLGDLRADFKAERKARKNKAA